MKKTAVFLISIMVSCISLGNNLKSNINIDNIDKLEIRFMFTLLGNKNSDKRKKCIDEKIIITDKKIINSIVSKLTYNEKLNYFDNLFQRKPDIVLNFYDSKNNLIYVIGVYEIKHKLDYIIYMDFKSNNSYYQGIGKELNDLLIKYYNLKIKK